MKLILVCPNCRTKKSIPVHGLVNSRNIQKLFKDNTTYCEICKSNGLGNILMNIEKFDRELPTRTIRDLTQLHVPTILEKDNMTLEQIQHKEKLKKDLGLVNCV